jgi:hypothetical protein
MISKRVISAAIGCALLMSASAVAEEPSVQPSIQAGQWQCGTVKSSKTGYSPKRNSPIDLRALYAPPRERVRGAVRALD